MEEKKYEQNSSRKSHCILEYKQRERSTQKVTAGEDVLSVCGVEDEREDGEAGRHGLSCQGMSPPLSPPPWSRPETDIKPAIKMITLVED